MDSRQRILLALNHKEPDKMPVDLGANRSTGIMVSAYDRLKKYIGIKNGKNQVYDMKQMLAIVEEPVIKRFGIDVVPLFRERYVPYPIRPYSNKWKRWQLFDETEVEIPVNYTPKEDEKGNLVLLVLSDNYNYRSS